MKNAVSLPAALVLFTLGACAKASYSTGAASSSPAPDMSMSAPTPDRRIGLKPGWFDAGEAGWNMSLLSNTRPSPDFINMSTPEASTLWNSDLAFTGNYAIQGNFSGYQVWDISNPQHVTLHTKYICPGSQSDVSVFRNLLFESSEATTGRTDCGLGGVADSISPLRARGIRVYDISDIAHPRRLTTVQTCRGSHTHTVVTDPNDNANVYVYISGSAPVRPAEELAGCSDLDPAKDPNSERFRIEVIQVPLAHPEQAHVVSKPAILADLPAMDAHGESPNAARTPATSGPIQCHDITVYPAIGLAGGACRGYGVLLDIRDAAHPKRVSAVSDPNFAAWHSATFNNDGTKILFTDEWGGGTSPRCRSTDKMEWGADAIFALQNNTMTFQSYYKMPAPQTSTENCVAHNGSMIPIPGRDVMVQGWYQGGISVFEFTDAKHPREIAYYDRGPMDANKLLVSGSWSAYWYNGHIVSSEITRGLDIYELAPSAFISQNELDAAKSVRLDELNVQDQPRYTWPNTFALARAYVDQLVRDNGLPRDRTSAIAQSLDRAEKMAGSERGAALNGLATQLDGDASGSASGSASSAKVRMLAATVRNLAR